MNKYLVFLLLFWCGFAGSQEIFSERIKGLRVYGSTQAGLPVVIQDSTALVVEFDLNEEHQADFKLRYYHCDRDWNKTRTSFINDDARNVTRFPLSYDAAPSGVEQYRFHYTVHVPGVPEVQRFLYSGNYIFELWDEQDKQLLGRGRFFVVEKTVKPAMRVTNYQLPSMEHPFNKVHRAEVSVAIPEVAKRKAESGTSGAEIGQSTEQEQLLQPIFVTSVDMYKNRELSRTFRIDASRMTATTFVFGFGTRRLRFVIDNLTPGNEYRRLDIRNVDEYPPGRILRARQGADLSRMLFRAGRDNNGVSS
ncbi:MAG: type IX secretion system plug protein domain-containing protein, partial [Bacteroidota bacterium]